MDKVLRKSLSIVIGDYSEINEIHSSINHNKNQNRKEEEGNNIINNTNNNYDEYFLTVNEMGVVDNKGKNNKVIEKKNKYMNKNSDSLNLINKNFSNFYSSNFIINNKENNENINPRVNKHHRKSIKLKSLIASSFSNNSNNLITKNEKQVKSTFKINKTETENATTSNKEKILINDNKQAKKEEEEKEEENKQNKQKERNLCTLNTLNTLNTIHSKNINSTNISNNITKKNEFTSTITYYNEDSVESENNKQNKKLKIVNALLLNDDDLDKEKEKSNSNYYSHTHAHAHAQPSPPNPKLNKVSLIADVVQNTSIREMINLSLRNNKQVEDSKRSKKRLNDFLKKISSNSTTLRNKEIKDSSLNTNSNLITERKQELTFPLISSTEKNSSRLKLEKIKSNTLKQKQKEALKSLLNSNLSKANKINSSLFIPSSIITKKFEKIILEKNELKTLLLEKIEEAKRKEKFNTISSVIESKVVNLNSTNKSFFNLRKEKQEEKENEIIQKSNKKYNENNNEILSLETFNTINFENKEEEINYSAKREILQQRIKEANFTNTNKTHQSNLPIKQETLSLNSLIQNRINTTNDYSLNIETKIKDFLLKSKNKKFKLKKIKFNKKEEEEIKPVNPHPHKRNNSKTSEISISNISQLYKKVYKNKTLIEDSNAQEKEKKISSKITSQTNKTLISIVKSKKEIEENENKKNLMKKKLILNKLKLKKALLLKIHLQSSSMTNNSDRKNQRTLKAKVKKAISQYYPKICYNYLNKQYELNQKLLFHCYNPRIVNAESNIKSIFNSIRKNEGLGGGDKNPQKNFRNLSSYYEEKPSLKDVFSTCFSGDELHRIKNDAIFYIGDLQYYTNFKEIANENTLFNKITKEDDLEQRMKEKEDEIIKRRFSYLNYEEREEEEESIRKSSTKINKKHFNEAEKAEKATKKNLQPKNLEDSNLLKLLKLKHYVSKMSLNHRCEFIQKSQGAESKFLNSISVADKRNYEVNEQFISDLESLNLEKAVIGNLNSFNFQEKELLQSIKLFNEKVNSGISKIKKKRIEKEIYEKIKL